MYILMSLSNEDDGDGEDYAVAVSVSIPRLKQHAEVNFKFEGKYVWGEEKNGAVYAHYDTPNNSYLHNQDAFLITEIDVI